MVTAILLTAVTRNAALPTARALKTTGLFAGALAVTRNATRGDAKRNGARHRSSGTGATCGGA
eukprot:3163127-Lingulodinium_polyedra.AAC.1